MTRQCNATLWCVVAVGSAIFVVVRCYTALEANKMFYFRFFHNDLDFICNACHIHKLTSINTITNHLHVQRYYPATKQSHCTSKTYTFENYCLLRVVSSRSSALQTRWRHSDAKMASMSSRLSTYMHLPPPMQRVPRGQQLLVEQHWPEQHMFPQQCCKPETIVATRTAAFLNCRNRIKAHWRIVAIWIWMTVGQKYYIVPSCSATQAMTRINGCELLRTWSPVQQ